MSETAQSDRRNRRTGPWPGAAVVGMFGFGYALVPIYDVYCSVTRALC